MTPTLALVALALTHLGGAAPATTSTASASTATASTATASASSAVPTGATAAADRPGCVHVDGWRDPATVPGEAGSSTAVTGYRMAYGCRTAGELELTITTPAGILGGGDTLVLALDVDTDPATGCRGEDVMISSTRDERGTWSATQLYRTSGCTAVAWQPAGRTDPVTTAAGAGGRDVTELRIAAAALGSPATVYWRATLVHRSGTESMPGPTTAWVLWAAPPRGAPCPARGPAGYWMTTTTGAVSGFGGAAVCRAPGSTPVDLIGDRVTAMAAAPGRDGSWLAGSRGVLVAEGGALDAGSIAELPVGEELAAVAPTPSGDGYWLFTNRGRVVAYGDAVWLGDLTGTALAGPVLGAVATPSGRGYYLVASDGGIFAFGDATFHGSMGGRPLNAPVRGLVPTASGAGYWLVASDGGVFAFGDADFRGSMGATPLNRPIRAMVRFGDGYLMVGEDGGIFSFSDEPFFGSLGANPPVEPITAVAAFGT